MVPTVLNTGKHIQTRLSKAMLNAIWMSCTDRYIAFHTEEEDGTWDKRSALRMAHIEKDFLSIFNNRNNFLNEL